MQGFRSTSKTMHRKRSPLHDFRHPPIEGAIREVIKLHPGWVDLPDSECQKTLVNSLAKRIVGVIVD